MKEGTMEKIERVFKFGDEVKTKDGLIFTTEALEVGKEIKQITDGGVIDVLDNTYEMESGEVVGGGDLISFSSHQTTLLGLFTRALGPCFQATLY
jgi:hypothetical protein